jgi:hypothetical protein
MTQLSKLQQLQALAAQAAETSEDMNEAVAGGQGAKLLTEGYYMARLVEYVEYGNQPQEYNGKAKDPAPEFRLGFALYHNDPVLSAEVTNSDGTPYIIRTFNISRSRNDKAGAFLLFKSLNWKATCKSYPELIGEAFLLKIVNKAGKAVGAKVTSRIDLKGFLPPLDAMSRQPYPIPQARDEDLLMFLWEFPSLEVWNSFKIDGQNDDGSSKNWIQNQILGATDFSGSALETLLKTSGVAYTIPVKTAPAASTPATGALPGVLPGVQPTPVTPVQATPVTVVQAMALPNVAAVAPVVVTAPLGLTAPALPNVPVMPALPTV